MFGHDVGHRRDEPAAVRPVGCQDTDPAYTDDQPASLHAPGTVVLSNPFSTTIVRTVDREEIRSVFLLSSRVAKINSFQLAFLSLRFRQTILRCSKMSSFLIPGKLQEHEVDVDTYSGFLVGQNWNKKFLKIDYDEVTQNIIKYILHIENSFQSLWLL